MCSSPITRKKRGTASRFPWKEHFSLSDDEKLGGPEKCVKINDFNCVTNRLQYRIQKDFRTAAPHHCHANPLPKTASVILIEFESQNHCELTI